MGEKERRVANNSLLYKLKKFYIDLQARFCDKLEEFDNEEINHFLHKHVKQEYQNKIKSEIIFKEDDEKFIERFQRFILQVVEAMTEFIVQLIMPSYEPKELKIKREIVLNNRKQLYQKILLCVIDQKLQHLRQENQKSIYQNVKYRVHQTELKKALEENRKAADERVKYSFMDNPQFKMKQSNMNKSELDSRDDKVGIELNYYKKLQQKKDYQLGIMRKINELKEEQEQLVQKVDCSFDSKIHPKLKEKEYYREISKAKVDVDYKKHSRIKHIQRYNNLVKDIKQGDVKKMGSWESKLLKKGEILTVQENEIVESDQYFQESGRDPDQKLLIAQRFGTKSRGCVSPKRKVRNILAI